MAPKKTSTPSTSASAAGPTGNDLEISRPAALPEQADEATLLRLFNLPTILARPTYLATSAWLEHVPFAFWLMEAQAPRLFVELGTHWGVSYFAFCQAAERLGLDVQAFAVDTWEGDEQSGFYGPQVFEKISDHNNALYSEFSRLVRSDFDTAREHFEDGSIDLLHIDGRHDYETVRSDFEAWLPKLSNRAVVVLHDSNMRERGFGVHRLVRELRERYPVFEFTHGHGLAVVGVGERQNASFERLFETGADPAARKAIQATFSRLGRACADSQLARFNAEARRVAEGRAEWLAQRVETLEALLDGRAPSPPPLQAEPGAEPAAPVSSDAAPAETAALDPQRDRDQETEDRLLTENEALRARVTGLQGDLHDRNQEIAALSRMVMKMQEDEASVQARIELAQREARSAERAVEQARLELAEALEQAGRQQEADTEREELRAALAKAREDVAILTQQAQYFQFENEAIRKSTSWKLSAPLRVASQAVRRPRKD